MNKQEATRIAGAVNAIRPDWGVNGILSILWDERLRHRAYTDIARVFVELALDDDSKKPTRIHHDGPWWHAAGPRGDTSASASIRAAAPDDCATCGHERDRCTGKADGHDYEPAVRRAAVQARMPDTIRDQLKAPKPIHQPPPPRPGPRPAADVITERTQETA